MLKLTDISRNLGDFALKDINLDISEGQYYVLLGRSGAGKTQLLELIAGLEHPDKGSIVLDNEDITTKKIQNRKIGIVFQDYAIFPHMSVFGNIAYPLKARKIQKDVLKDLVYKSASAMNIEHILERNAEKLSGGERQRVALARTLITRPRLLLLDEPLSSLDASLKDDMKRLLRNLNKAGQTIIHVTHDYSDAISLAKKVGVIHNGRIIQEGSVEEVFKSPSNRFVARYAGIRNFFSVNVETTEGYNFGITRHNLKFCFMGELAKKECLLIIKSDSIAVSKEKPESAEYNIFSGKIAEILPSEFGIEITIDAGDLFYVRISLSDFKNLGAEEGEQVWLHIPMDSIVVLNGTF